MNAERLWTRVGDAGEYEDFGDDLYALVEYFNMLGVGKALGRIRYGFESVTYWGRDYVSLYWGDSEAQPTRELSPVEWEQVAAGLCECFA